ncbi:MAG TPA: HAD family hydrolase [Candidatus Baltobacteraceae bacterium]|nr:HAD family hydrolase [Candidatus Baltobacteraceae bacterium]
MNPCGVIFDRDGTLVFDVPYNGDPQAVVPVPGMQKALAELRSASIPIAVVSNQSGVGRGMITLEQVEAVNRRVEELLGPFDAVLFCPHSPDVDCECRKPKPKLIVDAARAMGVDPACCVVIGDKPSDVEAAANAGARSIFVDSAYTAVDAVNAVLRNRPSS